jgi:LDH2 family malate/lactate/ureidoglycolate dehydrogenase
MITVPADRLRELGVKIFEAQGAPEETARFLVDTLVEANLTGHDSHGVHYFVGYSDRLSRGFIKADEEPRVVKETPTSALVDGRWAFGQVTAMRVAETAVKKARESMVAGVGAFNCNHIGRVGYYTSWAASQGIIANMYVNVGNPSASAFNGLGKAFGTNPYSVSVPTGCDTPFLVDWATSVVAQGKISVARAKHAKIPTHWTRDRYGRVTDDPNATYSGGWLLPFAEYKGYGMAMICDLLGAVLTGSRTAISGVAEPPSPNGVFMFAVNPEAFVGLEAFKAGATAFLGQVKALPAEAGKRVMVPGEPEKESKERRLREGIPVPDDTWAQIRAVCARLGVDMSDTEK